MNSQYLGRALMHRRNSADAHRAYVRDGRDLGLLPFWLLSRASPEFGRSFAHAVTDVGRHRAAPTALPQTDVQASKIQRSRIWRGTVLYLAIRSAQVLLLPVLSPTTPGDWKGY